MGEIVVGTFVCPVAGCSTDLSKLQVMHFRSRHGCDPAEWVQEQHGSDIREKYADGLGGYLIAEEYEWLSPEMVHEIVKTRSHEESMTSVNNPMSREEVASQFTGEDNPAKRQSVRKKISEAVTGHTLSEEAKQKISEKNCGNEISEQHRNAVSRAASEMDRSYMQTEEYSETLSEALRGREPTYPTPYEVEELSHIVRSNWEETIGKVLNRNGIQYEYEEEFELSDGSYYADFVLEQFVIEVKGWGTERSIRKAEEFMNRYPDYTYVVVGDHIPCDVHIPWESRSDLLEVIDDE